MQKTLSAFPQPASFFCLIAASALVLSCSSEGDSASSQDPAFSADSGSSDDSGQNPSTKDASSHDSSSQDAHASDAARDSSSSHPDGSQEPDGAEGPDSAGEPEASLPEAAVDSGCTGECEPGEVQRRNCGDCDSGTMRRYCSDSCSWQSWSSCQGELSGYPFSLRTGELLCPPYDRPAVFFSPHEDDESLAMAGAIAQHVQVGRQVFIEMLTHGEGSSIHDVLDNGQSCDWHPGTHQYSISLDDFEQARIREFTEAALILGVTGVFISDYGDANVTESEVNERIQFWLEQGGPNLSLKGIATAGSADNVDHRVLWSALLHSGHPDVRGYMHWEQQPEGISNPVSVVDISAWCSQKVAALDQYHIWNPSAGRYAVGYHSVQSWFDRRATDCREFVAIP